MKFRVTEEMFLLVFVPGEPKLMLALRPVTIVKGL